jgi:hypothetical protein
LGVWWRPALWGWLAVVGSYATCNLAASLVTARRAGLQFLLMLPIVFACYHIAYGYGFLRGAVDFVVFRRRPRPQYAGLTRGA